MTTLSDLIREFAPLRVPVATKSDVARHVGVWDGSRLWMNSEQVDEMQRASDREFERTARSTVVTSLVQDFLPLETPL